MLVVSFVKNNNNLAMIDTDYGDPNSIPADSVFQQHAVDLLGGVLGDYIIGKTDDATEKARVFNGDTFQCTQSGGAVTGFDFTLENDKLWIGFGIDLTNDKIRLQNDGTYDSNTLTIKVYKKDGVTLETTFGSTIMVDCLNPRGIVVPIEFSFIAGVHTETFVPTEWGDYKLPYDSIRVNDTYRIKNQLKISVYYKA